MICFDSQGIFICSLSAGKDLKQKEGFFWTYLLGRKFWLHKQTLTLK